MNEPKKALARLMFSGKIKTVLTVIMFLTVVLFSFGIYGMMSSVIEAKELVALHGIDIAVLDNNTLSGSVYISGFTGWMTVTIMLINMESFMSQYSAMCVMPVKRMYGLKYCIVRVSVVIGAMYLFEAVLLALELLELSVLHVLALLFFLGASVALFSVLYSLGIVMRKKNGRAMSVVTLLVIYAGAPLIGALKGQAYLRTVAADDGTVPFIVSLIIMIASVIGAVIAVNKTAEHVE